MKVKKINHIGVAVADLEKTPELYNDMLDPPLDHKEMLGELKIAFVHPKASDGVMIELVEPGEEH